MQEYITRSKDIAVKTGTTIALGTAASANAVVQTATNAPGALILDNATLAEIAKMIALRATPIAVIACWLAAAIAQPMRPIRGGTTLLAGAWTGACAESILIVTTRTRGIANEVVMVAGCIVAATPVLAVVAHAALKVANSASRVRELRQRQMLRARTKNT